MDIIIDYQYFGSVILYKNLYKYPNIYFEQYENYQKSGFRNKMILASPTGPQLLSIPILGGRGVKMKTANVQIDNRVKWQSNHIKTISNLYNRSPWYEYYKTELENLYKQKFELLKQWDLVCFQWACLKLKLDVIVAETTSFELYYDSGQYLDCRNYGVTKNLDPEISYPVYSQVFEEKTGFLSNISILDLLFCEGPNAAKILQME